MRCRGSGRMPLSWVLPQPGVPTAACIRAWAQRHALGHACMQGGPQLASHVITGRQISVITSLTALWRLHWPDCTAAAPCAASLAACKAVPGYESTRSQLCCGMNMTTATDHCHCQPPAGPQGLVSHPCEPPCLCLIDGVCNTTDSRQGANTANAPCECVDLSMPDSQLATQNLAQTCGTS